MALKSSPPKAPRNRGGHCGCWFGFLSARPQPLLAPAPPDCRKRAPRTFLRNRSCDRLRVAPGVAARLEQIVRALRPPTASGIKLTLRERLLIPGFPDWVDDAPGSFHFVAPDKQCRIAGEGFQQQSLVSFGGVRAKLRVVGEMHS